MKKLQMAILVLTCSLGATLASAYTDSSKIKLSVSSQATDEWIAPNSLNILPPPPKENTVMFQSDIANFYVGRDLKDKARWEQAAIDADYKNINAIYSEAFGYTISPETTPHINELIQFILDKNHDHSLRTAKNYYMRVRPFALLNMPTCTPEKEAKMRTTGSYPSGHASFGWAGALVLSQINPAREKEILNRGYEFGQSRVVCGAHWQSDVEAGRIMGGVVVSSLNNNPKYMALLTKAKFEFENLNK